jgi:hypothetical protein
VFSQDPTVCRYNSLSHQHTGRQLRTNTCQRSTHEQPPDDIRIRNGLCQTIIH